MQCKDIQFGTGFCSYTIYLPWKVDFTSSDMKCVAIDKCLPPEIIGLWEQGIKTTGCCCGHGNSNLSFICVRHEYISQMKDLGYGVQYNSCRPDDEDSFMPKTELKYGTNKDNGEWN